MPLNYIKGDIFESNCSVLAHGCNCHNNWDAGIAVQMKKHFPEAWRTDVKDTTWGDKEKLGGITWSYTTNSTGTHSLVFNLYSQYYYGRGKQFSEIAFRSALMRMKSALIHSQIGGSISYQGCIIGMPLIGAGLTGGNWEEIAPIVEEIFGEKTINIFVYDAQSIKKLEELNVQFNSTTKN